VEILKKDIIVPERKLGLENKRRTASGD
jgi:hypothetical protein